MLTIASYPPPFATEPPRDFVREENLRASAGDVLIVKLTYLSDDASPPDPIEGMIRGLRRRHPGCPVGLWIPEAPPQVVIDATRAASHAQVRAILGGAGLSGEQLRAQLTQPQGLSAFILRWASDAGYLPPEGVHEEVRELLDAAPDVRTLERLSMERQVAARTWRSRLQQLGLPTPRAWLGLAHALHVAFFVQRNAADSVQTLCAKLGMHTVANMTQQFRRVFELSPGQVRDLLGAEPLLHRWFQARSRPTHS